MKNIITEELGYMKYLFGYQRGVVISEQSNKTGCIKGNCKNGSGTYKWPSGIVYVGQFKDDRLNGQGTFTNINGVKSSGIWVNGKLNGKSLSDLDKITQSNQTKTESPNKEHWEDVVKYYEDNKDPNWKFNGKGDDGLSSRREYIAIQSSSWDINDNYEEMAFWDDGKVFISKKNKSRGTSKGTWEWDGTKPVIKFKDISKNASGYVQPTDTDWSVVTKDNKVIGLNSKGPLVKQVQRELIINGYIGETGSLVTPDIDGCHYDTEKCDGIYGKSTKKMVKQFQKDNGLSVDGIVGKQTYDAMNLFF